MTYYPAETLASGDKVSDSIWNLQVANNINYLGVRALAYGCASDHKAANTQGGTFTLGAWRTRDINTEEADTHGIMSIAANQITLIAGTYYCDIAAPAYAVGRHKARLYNITGAATLVVGTSAFSLNGGGGDQTVSIVRGSFTIAVDSVVEVQHQCQATVANVGFGIESNFVLDEVYTTANFYLVG